MGLVDFTPSMSRVDKIKLITDSLYALTALSLTAEGDVPTSFSDNFPAIEEKFWEQLGESIKALSIARLNPELGWVELEDFRWQSPSAGGGGWLGTAAGSSAVQIASADASNTTGVFQLSTSASATGNPALTNGAVVFAPGGGTFSTEIRARLATAIPDGTETYTVWVGLGDTTTTGLQTDGAYFYFDRATSTTNWLAVTAKGGVRTTVDTGIAAVNGSWVKFRVDIDAAATTVKFYINGALVSTQTGSTVPNTIGELLGLNAGMLKSAGTTVRLFQIDYWKALQIYTTPR